MLRINGSTANRPLSNLKVTVAMLKKQLRHAAKILQSVGPNPSQHLLIALSVLGATSESHSLSAPSGRPLFDLGATSESHSLSAPSGRPLFDLGATSESHSFSAPSGRPLFDLGATSESHSLSAPSGRPLFDLGATSESHSFSAPFLGLYFF